MNTNPYWRGIIASLKNLTKAIIALVSVLVALILLFFVIWYFQRIKFVLTEIEQLVQTTCEMPNYEANEEYLHIFDITTQYRHKVQDENLQITCVEADTDVWVCRCFEPE